MLTGHAVKLLVHNYRCLSLEVELDDFVVVIGPNGAGKSSLLEAMYLASSGGAATAPGRVSPLRVVLAARGMPYDPDVGADAAQVNDVRIARKACDQQIEQELNKAREGYGLYFIFGFLAKLAGFPVSEAAYRELGRLYACGPRGSTGVAVYANFLIDASRGEAAPAVFISPRLATEWDYVASLIDHIASVKPERLAEAVKTFDEFEISDVRNINGVPHLLIGKKAYAFSLVPASYAYGTVISLGLGAGDYVFIDEPEAHMHPGLINVVRDVVEKALNRGAKVAVATQSIEVLDKFSEIGKGRVIRMKRCKIHDILSMEEAKRRIDELYEDLRFY